MDRDAAIQFALSRRPESIGMARLCQELLAEVAGKPLAVDTPRLEHVCTRKFGPGVASNPWGRAGKPR